MEFIISGLLYHSMDVYVIYFYAEYYIFFYEQKYYIYNAFQLL